MKIEKSFKKINFSPQKSMSVRLDNVKRSRRQAPNCE